LNFWEPKTIKLCPKN